MHLLVPPVLPCQMYYSICIDLWTSFQEETSVVIKRLLGASFFLEGLQYNPRMTLVGVSVGVVCPLQYSLVGQMKGELRSLEEEEEEEEEKKSAASQGKKPAR